MIKKHKKALYIVAAILIVVFIYRQMKKRKASAEYNPGTSSTSSGTTSNVIPSTSTYTEISCTNSTVLKRGVKCHAVGYSQKQINMIYQDLGINKLDEDDKFGEKTEAAFVKLLGKKTGTYNEIVEARKAIKPN